MTPCCSSSTTELEQSSSMPCTPPDFRPANHRLACTFDHKFLQLDPRSRGLPVRHLLRRTLRTCFSAQQRNRLFLRPRCMRPHIWNFQYYYPDSLRKRCEMGRPNSSTQPNVRSTKPRDARIRHAESGGHDQYRAQSDVNTSTRGIWVVFAR
jgi:hypothetical protein